MSKNTIKLTLRKARAIALAELGTAAGLAPHENNHASFRCYEMYLGSHLVSIMESERYSGHASISFCGNEIIYDMETMKEKGSFTEEIRNAKDIEKAVSLMHLRSSSVFDTLARELPHEDCLRILEIFKAAVIKYKE